MSRLSEAVDWLDSHFSLENSRRGQGNKVNVPTLERIRLCMDYMGEPQDAYPIVHITGTNGKGSTAWITTELLKQSGLKVGTYTSPNLERINERIACDGIPIPDDELVEEVEALKQLEEHLLGPLTRFELLTALAYRWFADVAVDAAVIEVGMGGLWDATNVADATVAVITNVSYDHVEILGPTLKDIALEKSGIIKAASTAVVGEADPELVSIFVRQAETVGADRLLLRESDFSCLENRPAVGGRLLSMKTQEAYYDEVFLSLLGAHQGDNAVLALQAVESFFGSPLAEEIVENAMSNLAVPGRLEIVARHPLCVLDGAHNVGGARVIARALEEEFTISSGIYAVVGMLRGRDPVAMLDTLFPAGGARSRLRQVIACSPLSERALPSREICDAARGLGLEAVEASSVAAGVDMALELAGTDDLVLVTGSLYVVGDARSHLAIHRAKLHGG